MLRSDASRSQRILLFSAVGVVFAYLLISAREPLRLNWGDPWSDANVLTTLNYSSKYGFIATSFTDILDVGPLTNESYRYTHYPPFAEIFYGTVRKIAGGSPLDITVYRFFAIAFAGVGLGAFYRYVAQVWGKGLASWATILCATNLLWIQFADAMHQAPILFASGMTALAAVPKLVEGEGRWSRVAVVVGTYVCFLTAYDYYFFLPIAALLTARVLGVPLLSKRMLRIAAIIAISGALAIVTKSAFVTGAIGWKAFLEDVHFQFLERATTRFSPDYRSGFVIIIVARWTSYFTPAVFVAAAAVVGRLLAGARALGLRGSIRSLLFGSNELRNDPGSISILLVAALPFILVFSELSVEQVLPSQVMVPFFAVGCGYCIMWLGKKGQQLQYAAAFVFVAWQAVHMARIPKTFLDRDATAKVADYLAKNDTSDFLVTNLMSDGPIQYFFDRHLHMPTEVVEHTPNSYMELASKTKSGIIHAVYYDDPGTRLIDKSLWFLLPRTSQWAVFGTPYVLRSDALGEISEWDARVLEGLRRSGTEVLTLPGVRVFRLGVDLDARRAELRKKLEKAEPTRYIDFGTPESDVHKLTGFRFAEHYPGVPGFCWSVARQLQRTVLTKRGLEYRNDAPPSYESTILVRFDQSRDQRIKLVTWAAIEDQTLAATIDGKTVLPTHAMGPAQTRQEISFVVPKELVAGDPVKELVFSFRGVADYGGGVAFAIMNIDPVEP
ncbi:MAG: hypothetical protein BGO98_36645 [Myxococcales bacterium 68-20]|nr:hypothetical protein [Myxococcales bacterium]OJY26105.1 MAG: hypothetical protein BGO98_36645 [Myxococcales bacterium 68-20]